MHALTYTHLVRALSKCPWTTYWPVAFLHRAFISVYVLGHAWFLEGHVTKRWWFWWRMKSHFCRVLRTASFEQFPVVPHSLAKWVLVSEDLTDLPALLTVFSRLLISNKYACHTTSITVHPFVTAQTTDCIYSAVNHSSIDPSVHPYVCPSIDPSIRLHRGWFLRGCVKSHAPTAFPFIWAKRSCNSQTKCKCLSFENMTLILFPFLRLFFSSPRIAFSDLNFMCEYLNKLHFPRAILLHKIFAVLHFAFSCS